MPDDPALRRQPLDRPDPQSRTVRQREFAENSSGPERRDADDLRPAGVLNCAGDDLRSAGRPVVYEDDERQVGCHAAVFDQRRLLLALGVALDVDRPRGEKLAGDRDGFTDVAAGIAAEIEDEPVGARRPRSLEGRDERVGRALRELFETDHGRLRARDHRPRDGLDVNVGADDLEGAFRRVGPGLDRQHDGRPGFAANPGDDRVEVGAGGRSAVDCDHDVAGVETGGVRRTVAEYSDDERQAVGRGVHLGTDPDVRPGQ